MRMVVVLALVALLVYRARDPENWRWLVPEVAEDAADIDPAKGVPKELAVESKPIPAKSSRPLPAATPNATGKSIAALTSEAIQGSELKDGELKGREIQGDDATSLLAESLKGRTLLSSSLPTLDRDTSQIAKPKVIKPDPAKAEPTLPDAAEPAIAQPEVAADPLQGAPDPLAGAPVATGPTDLDEEEFEAAIDRFQVVSDGSLGIEPEEMPAYSQILNWVRHQPLKLLAARAVSGVTLHDLMVTPANQRGQILKLDLNVRRILPLKFEFKPGGFETLYEVWGFNADSGGHLYVGITPYLPEGMPTGTSIHERATFYGYFYKLQGYIEAKAAPRAVPLQAPLLIGRMQWHRSSKAAVDDANQFDNNTTWLVGGLGLLFISYIALRTLLSRRAKADRVSRETTESLIGDFLDEKPDDQYAQDDDFGDDVNDSRDSDDRRGARQSGLHSRAERGTSGRASNRRDADDLGPDEKALWRDIVDETPRKG